MHSPPVILNSLEIVHQTNSVKRERQFPSNVVPHGGCSETNHRHPPSPSSGCICSTSIAVALYGGLDLSTSEKVVSKPAVMVCYRQRGEESYGRPATKGESAALAFLPSLVRA